jgi:RimJ/RimL family protein N-acetyltransferase
MFGCRILRVQTTFAGRQLADSKLNFRSDDRVSLEHASQHRPAMSKASTYSSFELLRNGRRIEIRALRPEDRADIVAAVDHMSVKSLYRRFFGIKRHFSEREIDFFLNVDFANHVVLVAVMRDAGRAAIVGGTRYIVLRPGVAELAFTVVDKFQGQGIGRVLMRHITSLAREAGLKDLIADVLPENTPMLKVFEKSGLKLRTTQENGVVHVVLQLTD